MPETDGPFKTMDELELATLSWVRWFTEQRLIHRSTTPHRASTSGPSTVTTTPDSSGCRDN
jgi:hypothetical protein